MDLKLRRCMVSDAPFIYKLCKEELGYEFTEEQVTANVRRLLGSVENLMMVAVDDDDEVVGFIHAQNHDPVYAPPMKDIIAIAIEPEYRMHGLGKRLIAAVEDWAKATGAAGVRANASSLQKNALIFYKKAGYVYIKTNYNVRKMF